MSDNLNPSWECPICFNSFKKKEDIIALINKINEWFEGRPSASMDPSFERRESLVMTLNNLKSVLARQKLSQEAVKRNALRIMESQNFMDKTKTDENRS